MVIFYLLLFFSASSWLSVSCNAARPPFQSYGEIEGSLNTCGYSDPIHTYYGLHDYFEYAPGLLELNQTESSQMSSMVNIGDVDGDGNTDVAIASPVEGHSGLCCIGAFHIVFLNSDMSIREFQKIGINYFRTSQPPLYSSYSWQAQYNLGKSMVALPDMDGDGIMELVLGAPTMHRPTSAVWGAYPYSGDAGAYQGGVLVYYYDSTGTIKDGWNVGQRLIYPGLEGMERIGPQWADDVPGGGPWISGTGFGMSVAVMDDMDADGVSELVVGIPGYDLTCCFPVGTYEDYNYGGVYLLLLQESGNLVKAGGTHLFSRANGRFNFPLHTTQPHSVGPFDPVLENIVEFGSGVAAAGDVNGDAIQDLAVTASQSRRMFILLLNANFTYQEVIESASFTDPIPVDMKGFEFSAFISPFQIANLGDVNGDGTNDFVIGARASSHIVYLLMNNNGTVKQEIFHGSIDEVMLGFPYQSFVVDRTFADSDGVCSCTNGGCTGDSHYSCEWSGFGERLNSLGIMSQHPSGVLIAAGAHYSHLAGPNAAGAVYVFPPLICDCSNSGFTGMFCDVPCLNGGQVFDHNVAGCDCTDTEYVGDLCDIPCLNGGVNSINSRTRCNCTGTGHVGELCEIPCENGGDNTDGYVDYCDCGVSGSTGLGTLCESLCQNGGAGTSDNVACACNPAGGWFGKYCDVSCENGGLFVSTDICACDLAEHYTRADNGACTRYCNEGYPIPESTACNCTGTGTQGTTCQNDLDDCNSNPCANSGICTDQGAFNYTCDCLGGWIGRDCDVAPPSPCLSAPCMHGTCMFQEPVSFSCNCTNTGYEGTFCSNDIDDCLSAPCQNGGSCADTGTYEYYCDCVATGYEGPQCEMQIDDCLSSPCLNNGSCADKTNRYKCTCAAGFEGSECEIDIDECLSAPCIDITGATCVDEPNGYFCEELPDLCLSNPCEIGYTCKFKKSKYEYECKYACDTAECPVDTICVPAANAAGYDCVAVVAAQCTSEYCLNGGTCVQETDGSLVCDCTNVTRGDFCEIDLSEAVCRNILVEAAYLVPDIDSFMEFSLPGLVSSYFSGLDLNVTYYAEVVTSLPSGSLINVCVWDVTEAELDKAITETPEFTDDPTSDKIDDAADVEEDVVEEGTETSDEVSFLLYIVIALCAFVLLALAYIIKIKLLTSKVLVNEQGETYTMPT